MRKFYWSGISNEERTKALYELTGIVDHYGTILHFLRFSDISIGLSIETEECKAHPLYESLKSIMFMEGIGNEQADSLTDCLILLNVTFIRGTGNLTIEVPAIIE